MITGAAVREFIPDTGGVANFGGRRLRHRDLTRVAKRVAGPALLRQAWLPARQAMLGCRSP